MSFTPWVVAAQPGEQPWGLLAFRIAGYVALAAVALAGARGALSFSGRSSRAALAAIAIVAVAALSAALSVHRGKSLEAMLNGLGILGLFLAAAVLIRGARWIRAVAVIEVLAAASVALMGIAQHFRPDLVPAESSYPGRALGPLRSFGQPNRFGGFLIASIPLAIALAFVAHDRVLRFVLFAAVLALALALVYTYSRGAWLGLGAGLLVLAALLVRWPSLRPEPVLAAFAAALLVIPILLALPSIAGRLASRPAGASWNLPIDPEREGSGSMRRAVWSGALAAASHRPVLGWGVGAFLEGYDRSKSATLKRLEAEGGRTADQAHSFYLETLAERGALGLAAFLLFSGLVLAGGLAALGTGAPADARLLSAGLLASLVALLAHALLEDNLSFAAHGAVFAANAGLLAAAAPGRKRALRLRAPGVLGLAAALAAGVLAVLSAFGASAAQAGGQAMRSGAAEAALASYERADRLSPWNDAYAIGAAHAAEAAAVGGAAGERLGQAERFYRGAIAANGSDPVTRHELARLYLAHPDRFGADGGRAAIGELRAALAQNPYYAEIRNDLGVALLRSGDLAGATREFEAASQGRRAFVDPLLNLAALAIQRGDRAEAARRVGEALARDPGSERARAMQEEVSRSTR
ncbi:MAG TPA: O-antigen ligase family protein [Candidatus Omnitrophota bacterium]|nr:O-antigen ligase family protein [Candidatus Omnitrophota bacterium]